MLYRGGKGIPMVTIARLIALVLEGIFLQFAQIVGLVALLLAAAAGFLRAPSWTVPVLAFVFGLGAEQLQFGAGLLDKAASASERWGFTVSIYFLIAFAGYLGGVYARRHLEKRGRIVGNRQ